MAPRPKVAPPHFTHWSFLFPMLHEPHSTALMPRPKVGFPHSMHWSFLVPKLHREHNCAIAAISASFPVSPPRDGVSLR